MPRAATEKKIDYLILGILNHEPMSGSDIKGRIDREVSYFWTEMGYNKIYPSIKRLEKKKLITLKRETKSYPPKKIYEITKKGKKYLNKWLIQPVKETKQSFAYLQEFLLKLHFSGDIPVEIVNRNIAALESWLKEILETFDLYENSLRQVLDDDRDHIFYLLSFRFGKTIYEALQDWTQEARQLVK
ncbi:MAG: hypothetical protein GF308_20105 [Candidatus Heimdallarchaeota archaeon]|nr:hypothetical protein [Candidatus Heimdallarchaeota archaeon]